MELVKCSSRSNRVQYVYVFTKYSYSRHGHVMAINVFREYCTFYATLFIFAGETLGYYFRGRLRSDKTE